MEIIHIVLGKANPNRMNGVNKVVYQLATQQASSGRNASVWGFSKNQEVNFPERTFRTVLFKAVKNPFKLDPEFEKRIQACGRETCFHIHGGWIPTFYSISNILEKYDLPFVITPHGAYNTIAMEKNAVLKSIYFQLFEKSLIKKSSFVHCIGQSEMTGLDAIYKNNKSFLQPYGFDDIMLTSKEKNTDAFVFGFLGRLDIHTKGLDLMISAFAAAFKNKNSVKLWIIGDSDQRSELEKRVSKLGITQQVVFWGAKYEEEKMDLLSKIDFFLHPSRNEGLPSSVLEASALGIPSIVSRATNVGGYIESYESGYCIEDNSSEALADAMEKSYHLSIEERRQKSSRAKAMVQEVFSWQRVIMEFDKLYTAA